MSISIPASVFFLSLNRLFALSFPLSYTPRCQRWLLQIEKVCIALGVTSVFFAFGSYISPKYLSRVSTEPSVTRCLAFNCLIRPVWVVHTGTKASLGFANLCVATLLLARVWWMRVESRRASVQSGRRVVAESVARGHRTANTISLVAVGTEFFFNFLPQVLVVLLGWVSGTENPSAFNLETFQIVPKLPTDYFGSYTTFFLSLDGLITSLVYTKVLGRVHSHHVAPVAAVGPLNTGVQLRPPVPPDGAITEYRLKEVRPGSYWDGGADGNEMEQPVNSRMDSVSDAPT